MREFGTRQVGAYDPFRLVLCEDAAAANHGSHMHKNEVTPQMASFFYSHFRGRKDVYSVRSRPKDGKRDVFQSAIPSAAARAVWGFVRGR